MYSNSCLPYPVQSNPNRYCAVYVSARSVWQDKSRAHQRLIHMCAYCKVILFYIPCLVVLVASISLILSAYSSSFVFVPLASRARFLSFRLLSFAHSSTVEYLFVVVASTSSTYRFYYPSKFRFFRRFMLTSLVFYPFFLCHSVLHEA